MISQSADAPQVQAAVQASASFVLPTHKYFGGLVSAGGFRSRIAHTPGAVPTRAACRAQESPARADIYAAGLPRKTGRHGLRGAHARAQRRDRPPAHVATRAGGIEQDCSPSAARTPRPPHSSSSPTVQGPQVGVCDACAGCSCQAWVAVLPPRGSLRAQPTTCRPRSVRRALTRTMATNKTASVLVPVGTGTEEMEVRGGPGCGQLCRCKLGGLGTAHGWTDG